MIKFYVFKKIKNGGHFLRKNKKKKPVWLGKGAALAWGVDRVVLWPFLSFQRIKP